MKRVLYSIPLFLLLLPWLFFSLVVLAVGLQNPFALLLLIPTGALLGGTFFFHRGRTKVDQHGIAALGTATLLISPIVVLLVGFACGGKSLATEQAMEIGALDGYDTTHLYAKPADEGCEVVF